MTSLTSLTVWLKGLMAAVLGGAIAGAAQSVSGGSVSGPAVKTAAIAGAGLTLVAYLAQSPVSSKTDGGSTTSPTGK